MSISPDELVLLRLGPFALNATIVFTWVVGGLLVGTSWLVTRRLSTGIEPSRGQHVLEVLVTGVLDQIRDIGRQDPAPFLPFVGTLFIFIAASNLLAVVPGFTPPTGSLSTTAALALCVFVAVPAVGIARRGFGAYFKQYLRPSVLMLPFNVIGEFSRTLALAVRLYGNVMSGTVIAGILLGIAPFFFPVVMQLLGLLTGMIQAYIFAVLAMVYLASGVAAQEAEQAPVGPEQVDAPEIDKEDSRSD